MRSPDIYCKIKDAVLSGPENLLTTLEAYNWSKEKMEQAVKYLDQIVPWYHEKLDKMSFRSNIPRPDIAKKIDENVLNVLLFNIILTIRHHFDLNFSVVENAIFVQKLNLFFDIQKIVKHNKLEDYDLAVMMKLYILMHKDQRIQFAVLKYFLMKEKNLDQALTIGYMVKVREDNWPSQMKEKVKEENKLPKRIFASQIRKDLRSGQAAKAKGNEFLSKFDLSVIGKPTTITELIQLFPSKSTTDDSAAKQKEIQRPRTKFELYQFIGNVILKEPEHYLTRLESTKFSVEELECMVGYLDQIAAWEMEQLDKYNYRKDIPEPKLATSIFRNVKNKKLVNIVFGIRNHFNLSMSCVASSIFVRKMVKLRKFVKETPFDLANIDLCFVQKICHLMRGCERAQFAVLRYLSENNQRHALFFALFAKVPQDNWPKALQKSKWKAKEQLKKVRKVNQILSDEYKKYTRGFEIAPGHKAHMIDTIEKLESLFYPFLDNYTQFSFDSEWDQSYSGAIGDLCLIQLSSEKETMLIDVKTLSSQHNFEWAKFFCKLFDLKNTIYGFALLNDLQNILHNFPYLYQSDCMKFTNLICLRETMDRILKDEELSTKLFGDNKPQQNSLASLALYFFGSSMDKGEQLAVWSERPFRFVQLKYAAKDSFFTFFIQQKLIERVKTKSPENFSELFKPISWPVEKHHCLVSTQPVEKNAKIKSKDTHFTYADLVELVKKQNAKFDRNGTKTIDPRTVCYITDTMYTQLGRLLERCNVNVIFGLSHPDIIEKASADSKLRIITCGKAVKKFPFGNRVLNVPASKSALDELFLYFLDKERLRINMNAFNTRVRKR